MSDRDVVFGVLVAYLNITEIKKLNPNRLELIRIILSCDALIYDKNECNARHSGATVRPIRRGFRRSYRILELNSTRHRRWIGCAECHQ